MSTMQTFYFNTGVKPDMNTYRHKDIRISNGTIEIPINCENVPDGAKLEFLCDDPNLFINQDYIVRKAFNTKMHSQYAYFKL